MMKEERESTSAGSAGSADPAFKLFGKTIDVNATSDSAENASSGDAAPSISQVGTLCCIALSWCAWSNAP